MKLGGIEMFELEDSSSLTKHSLQEFGFDRCVYESNWFMTSAYKNTWDRNYDQILNALEELGATEEEKDAVYRKNAIRVYSL
jgi:predicted TIM-barrel fold metal-dependent hydrolase